MNLNLGEFSVINIDSKQKGFSNFREAFYLVRLAGFEPAHPVPETKIVTTMSLKL